ncbi:hypothetical protein [Anabaenopsis elenkinii]|uniref:Uncharacterized protein n=1 Tax=Anabaenopsis elenkinii CCIBt3563 TaxID=2779889 RepID=A0A7U3RXK6_9CYAN|nr:hypothetical protein [Anabaenopsis elenkinii]QOV21118.1 hypothetical protein IM676_09920 [Anabaenopsis elenkinii CCIBt3563]
MSFDPRTLASPIYDALNNLRALPNQDDTRLKQQKSQAVELYTYLSTWGMMRLKAEETALGDNMEGKKQVVKKFFQCLEEVSGVRNLAGDRGLDTLRKLGTDEYLGLTGLGLALAQEFSFWATAIYADIKGE